MIKIENTASPNDLGQALSRMRYNMLTSYSLTENEEYTYVAY